MKKINKNSESIFSVKYKSWIGKNSAACNNGGYRYYYDDVIMNLYKCQSGVCAYTEMYICIPELYSDDNWLRGRYRIENTSEIRRLDHLGEMDHYDAQNKNVQYWNWDNLFMIHAKINSIKTNTEALAYLKPDTEEYSPEKYLDYDESTHRFIPNTDLENEIMVSEIQNMIDNVLFLNHGVVRNERKDFINLVKSKRANNEVYNIDRFFTATNWCLND